MIIAFTSYTCGKKIRISDSKSVMDDGRSQPIRIRSRYAKSYMPWKEIHVIDGERTRPDIVISSPKRRDSIPLLACALKLTPAFSRSWIDSALHRSTLRVITRSRLRWVKTKVELPNRAVLCHSSISGAERKSELNQLQTIHVFPDNGIVKKVRLIVLRVKADSGKLRILEKRKGEKTYHSNVGIVCSRIHDGAHLVVEIVAPHFLDDSVILGLRRTTHSGIGCQTDVPPIYQQIHSGQ